MNLPFCFILSKLFPNLLVYNAPGSRYLPRNTFGPVIRLLYTTVYLLELVYAYPYLGHKNLGKWETKVLPHP